MPAELNIYNPDELGAPMGQYTHVTRVKANEFLFIAGMLSGDAAGNVIGEGDFDAQTTQVFRNIEGGAEIGRRVLGQCRAVHDLSGALAGHSEVHGVPPARIPENVSEREIPAEHAAHHRPPGEGAVSGRGADDRSGVNAAATYPSSRGAEATTRRRSLCGLWRAWSPPKRPYA
jgi:hypothetical protein